MRSGSGTRTDANPATVAAQARVDAEKARQAADDKARLEANAKQAAQVIATAREQLKKKDLPRARATAEQANALVHTTETAQLLADIQQEERLAVIKSDTERRAAEAR